MRWVIVCLGTEPLVFGGYDSRETAEKELLSHCSVLGLHGDTNYCSNGVEWDEHHILEMQ